MGVPNTSRGLFAVGAEDALRAVGRALMELGYQFTSVTPETHARVMRRRPGLARDLRDVFGWNYPFAATLLPSALLTVSHTAGIFEATADGNLRSKVRFATLGGDLLAHSSFPTLARDAVFFGPDTYRFCAFVRRNLTPVDCLVDVGCGSGAGGLHVRSSTKRLVLADINPSALRVARVNAALVGAKVELVESNVLSAVTGRVDAVIANPPYMRDTSGRTYRDGGGTWGEALSVRIARESIARLPSGGRLLLYTGAPIVAGVDVLRAELEALCKQSRAAFTYEELDPDVFGEQLDEPHYENVERIAAVGLCAVLP
jgi:release factor glutamine methyltransferase